MNLSKSITHRKSVLSAAIAGVLLTTIGSGLSHAGTTIVFADNITPVDPFPANKPAQTASFSNFNEFRVITEAGNTSGGGEKSIVGDAKITGAGKATTLPHDFVTWNFNDANQLASVANSEMTPGAHYYAAGCGYISGTCVNVGAAPNGDTGLFLNAAFLGSPFGFLAPTVGSAAATQYGVSTINITGSSLTVRHEVAEAQWSEGYFTLGLQGGVGIVFTGTIEGDNHTFRMRADSTIEASEDSLGFSGQNTQWDVVGAVNSDPSPAIATPTTDDATPLVIPISDIAIDREGDALTITTASPAVTGTAGGTADCSAGTSCTFTPDGSTGNADFTVTVIDDADMSFPVPAGSSAIDVTVIVTGAGSPPIAVDDDETSTPSTVVDQNSIDNGIDLDANDVPTSDPIDPDSIVIMSGPGDGSIAMPLPSDGSGTVLYTPDPGFSGTDTFTYTIDDDMSNTSNEASVTVTVNCAEDACAAAGPVVAGSLVMIRLTADDLIPGIVPEDNGNGGVEISCNPDCFDFVAPTSSPAVVVLTLSGPLAANSQYRKVRNGAWEPFDTSNGIDKVESALGSLGSCPPAGSADYASGLAEGDFCIQLTIEDGGPNDGDIIPNQVTDPGGPGSGDAPTVVLKPESLGSSSGCSIAATSAKSGKVADWWLLGAFMGWLGLTVRRRRQNH